MASDGDPRVQLALNLVLSAVFVYAVLRGLEFIGALEWSIPRFVLGTVALMLLTHVVTR